MNQQKTPKLYICGVFYSADLPPLKLPVPRSHPLLQPPTLCSADECSDAAGVGGAGLEPGNSCESPIVGMGCPGSSSAVNQVCFVTRYLPNHDSLLGSHRGPTQLPGSRFNLHMFLPFSGAILYLMPFPEHGNLLSVHKLHSVPPDASLFTLISSYSN